MSVEERLRELGVVIPAPRTAAGSYVQAVTTGNLVYISGNGPFQANGTMITGKLGRDLTVEEGYAAARVTVIMCLAALQAEVGSLERVTRVVKLLGMVNCTEDFERQPDVINGASDLLVAVFGEKGKHARSAVGMQMLPFGIAVEIEMIVEVAPA